MPPGEQRAHEPQSPWSRISPGGAGGSERAGGGGREASGRGNSGNGRGCEGKKAEGKRYGHRQVDVQIERQEYG